MNGPSNRGTDRPVTQHPTAHKIRTANFKDNRTRECPAIAVDFSLPGEMLERMARERGYPGILVIDNGPELRSRAVDGWVDDHGVQLYFIEAGKPTQNAYIKSFNGRSREECLNQHWFTRVGAAREIIEEWAPDYNAKRPHSSLNYPTPEKLADMQLFDETQWTQLFELFNGSTPAPIAHAAE